MPRGLNIGMLGWKQRSLAPSNVAVGPNTYLREKDFLTMLGIALVVHALAIGIASLLPKEAVKDIPVRALSFKIGDTDRVAAYGLTSAIGTTTVAPTPEAPATPLPLRRVEPPKPASSYTPQPVKPQKIVPPEQRRMPIENSASLQPLPQEVAPPPPQPAAVQPMPAALPSTEVLTQYGPAIAQNPQRFVREAGAAPVAGEQGATNAMGQGSLQGAVGGQGTENVMTAQTMQAIRERYEQQISAWIQQHKLYPAAAGGREGKAILRVRIDRSGYVRYYAIEQSTNVAALDAAAIDMIRRANPVPAVPADYPAGNLIEFLIPITFRVPQ